MISPITQKGRNHINFTFRVHREVANEVRAFVRDRRGAPLYLAMGKFAQEALILHMERLRER